MDLHLLFMALTDYNNYLRKNSLILVVANEFTGLISMLISNKLGLRCLLNCYSIFACFFNNANAKITPIGKNT